MNSTGVDDLDRVLDGLLPGDNVVWLGTDLDRGARRMGRRGRAARDRTHRAPLTGRRSSVA